jgi:hypothetical protein
MPTFRVGSGMECTALAYRLLLGQDIVDVGRWFEEFCAASCDNPRKAVSKEGQDDDGKTEGEEDDDGNVKGGRGRSKGRLRGRRLGRRLSPEDERAPSGRATTFGPKLGRSRSKKRVRVTFRMDLFLCD